MKKYNLYCGSQLTVIGDFPEAQERGFVKSGFSSGLIADILDGKITDNLYIRGDADELLEQFKSIYEYIEAAGGYVLNADGQSLVIFRNGLWDLPKGKVEPDEDVEHAAVREVMEETGISAPVIERKIADTYHFYRWHDSPKIFFKKTYWFLMSYNGDEPQTIPQTCEGITEALWIDDTRISEMLEKTHRNLKILFRLKKEGSI